MSVGAGVQILGLGKMKTFGERVLLAVPDVPGGTSGTTGLKRDASKYGDEADASTSSTSETSVFLEGWVANFGLGGR